MAWITIISEKEASGRLKRHYEAALKRAGKVYNVVKLSSLRPEILQSSIDFYINLMHAPGKLTRAQREMLAVVTSQSNDCFY